jgi:TolB-like protein/Tfp pilus assembly protein PilF
MQSTAPFRASFGPFELDLSTGELRKHGIAVRLQEQPFQLLKALIQRPGEVVTKEQLREILWPKDVFVDFDHGLNSALTKLRATLADTAEVPRYIETVSRRGYRFVGQLEKRAIKTTRGRTMLAVLPFENLSDGPDQEFFSDGMTEEMITQLSRLDPANLGVIARTSSMLYKKTDKNAHQIGLELKVDYILEGSIRRSSERVRITAQLIQTSDQSHIWGEGYDRTFEDILKLQTEAAEQIARSLAIELLPDFNRVLMYSHKTDPETFDNYLRGRYHWNKRIEEGFTKALQYFYKVVEKDPNYAPAYAGIADTYNIFALYGSVPAREAYQRAKAAAIKALEIDNRLAEAHTSLGWARIQHDWDGGAAEMEHLRALELNPNYATGHHWYALFLAEVSRFEEAIREVDRALELDPFSRALNAHKGWILYFARRFEEARLQLEKTVQMDSSFALAVYFLGLTLEQLGRYPEAIAALHRSVELSAGHPGGLCGLSHAYALSGDNQQASVVKDELLEMAKRRHVSPYFIAVAFAGIGDNDRAFDYLEQSFQERSGWMVHLAIEPQLDSLRSDPRFGALVRRVGLSETTTVRPLAFTVGTVSGDTKPAGAIATEKPSNSGPGVASRQIQASSIPSPTSLPETGPDETEEFELARDSDHSLLAGLLAHRGLVAAVIVLVLITAGIWKYHGKQSFSSVGKIRIAVLPLKNLSGEASQIPFTQGMTEELITELGRLNPRHLGVIARTTAVQYADRNISQIRNDLNADYVIEGGILHAQDDRVRITINLIQTKDETHVWAESYEDNAKDSIGLQRRVAVAIAREVNVKLGPLRRPVEVNPEAYDAFFRGRYFWNKRGPDAVERSIHYFQEAIQRDPKYARPYAGLADAFALLGSTQSGALPPDVAFPKAKQAALRSIELDPDLAEPHASLGYIKLVYERDSKGAKEEFSRALDLDPNYVTARQWFGQYYLVTGELQQAIRSVQEAHDLEPASLPVNIALAEVYYFARDFDRAIDQSRKALELDPNSTLAYFNLGRAYEMKGMHIEALAAFENAQKITASPATLVPIGYTLGRAGRKKEAEQVLVQLNAMSRRQYVPAICFAMIYAGMDDKDQTFAALERAKFEHCDYIGFLPLEPMADPFRGDPRFEKIIR